VDQSGDGFHLVHAIQVVFQLGDLPIRVQPRLATTLLIILVVVLIIAIIELLRRIGQTRRPVGPIFVVLNGTGRHLKVYLNGLVIKGRVLSVVTIKVSLDEPLNESFLTRG
jgi:ABC-type enterobactin transport system permease subunit